METATRQHSAKLTIASETQQRQIDLPPAGVFVGHSTQCDVHLPDPDRHVSRRHARLYRNPAGCWVVEDLGSKNGTWVDGERITSQTVYCGQEIHVGPYRLTISEPTDSTLRADLQLTAAASISDDTAGRSQLESLSGESETLSIGRVEQLNRLGDRLGRVSQSANLYPELCELLADAPDMVAIVLRLARGDRQPAGPIAPEVLACAVSGHSGEFAAKALASLHLSRRVLEAVRSDGEAVLARNDPAGEADLMLTLASPQRPRTVICAPILAEPESVEALYLDMPAEAAEEGVLAFTRAAARLARLLRTNLTLSDEKRVREALEQEFARAQKIQQSLLPRRADCPPCVDVSWFYEPMSWVGGDYCDVWTLADGRLAFAVGDVSGHGLDAAMVMATVHAAMRAFAACGQTPAAVMEGVNRYLGAHLPGGMFMTMLLGFYQPGDGRIEYVRAGHNPPLIVSPAGRIRPLESGQLMLGVETVSYLEDAVHLPPGHALLAFTDGVVEGSSPDGEQFGGRRLHEAARSVQITSSQDLVAAVVAAAADFRHPLRAQDDVTVFALVHHAAADGAEA